MKKAEYKFHRDRRQQIQNASSENDAPSWYFKAASNSPIYLPKRKKKK